jgi:hypothetical protein
MNRKLAILALLFSCKSSDRSAPAPAPAAAPTPAAQLIEQMFGKPTPDAFPDQLDKLRELARTASPKERPLVEKMLRFAEDSARTPKDYARINRRYVALIAELVPALGPGDFKLALKLVGSTSQVWQSTRYHGDFELDAPVARLHTDLVAAYPAEPIPAALLAQLISQSHLDEQAGLAAAKHCIEHIAKADPQFRAQLEEECRRLHGELAAAFTAPRCTSLRDDLVFYRGGPRKSEVEIEPTTTVVVAGQTFYRQPKPLTDSTHLTEAVQSEPRALMFVLDAQAALAAEDLRGGMRDVDDWIIVEAGGKPLLAGGWDLDFGRLILSGTPDHEPKLELVCKTAIEQRILPPQLAPER